MQEAESLYDGVAIMHEVRFIACDPLSKLIDGLQFKRIVEVEALNIGSELVSKIQGLDLVEKALTKFKNMHAYQLDFR